MNAAAVTDLPSLTVTMPDITDMEDITSKQRMMSSCTGAILTSLFGEFFTVILKSRVTSG